MSLSLTWGLLLHVGLCGQLAAGAAGDVCPLDTWSRSSSSLVSSIEQPNSRIQTGRGNNSKAVHGADRSRQEVKRMVIWGGWVTDNWLFNSELILSSADKHALLRGLASFRLFLEMFVCFQDFPYRGSLLLAMGDCIYVCIYLFHMLSESQKPVNQSSGTF